MTAKIKIDASGPIRLFKQMTTPKVMTAIQTGVGKAAHLVETSMREQLQSMIYSRPETPGYKRTYRLFRGAHAANPKWNHADDGYAAEEIDLKTTSNTDIVEVEGFVFKTEVGDWVSYALAVHEGYGFGTRTPRPFSAQPLMEADGHMRNEVNQAIAAIIGPLVI